MMRLALHQLRAHKRRLVSTVLAVALGVSFLVGTLVLSNTTHATFDSLFTGAYAGTDAAVNPKPIDGLDASEAASAALMEGSLVDRVASVDGVDHAQPVVEGYGKLVGSDGKPVGTMGPPNVAGNWVDDARLNPYRVASGRTPITDDEVIVNVGAADAGKLHVGDRTTVLTPSPVPVTIVGLSRFGEFDSAGGMTYVAFTREGAERHVTGQPGKVTGISIAAKDGTSREALAQRVAAVVGPDLQVRTQAQLVADSKQGIDDDFLGFLDRFLMAFAVIALLVATFSIANTFSIIVAQRTRESALVRALGAGRRQVLGATLVEMLAIGLLASILGIAGGVAIAAGLKGLFSLLGAALPATGIVLTGSTVVTGLLVGTVLTVVAGVLPARRASRVAPLAALRDVSIDRTSTSVGRVVTGSVLTIAGVVVVVTSALASGDGVLPRTMLGALALMTGAVVLGPVIAVPAVRILGWPISRRRAAGRLARENAMRNPRRTSGTAAALMIGVAVVTLFTVVASSLKASVADSVGRSFAGDLVISSSMNGGFSSALASDVASIPEVETSVGLGAGVARVDEADTGLMVVEPSALAQVMDLDVTSGSLGELGPRQLAISKAKADERHWKLGSSVPVRFADGTEDAFTVGAVYDDNSNLGDLIMSRADWEPHAVQDLDVATLVALRPGSDASVAQQAIQHVADRYPGTDVQTREQYVASVAANIDQSLVLIYVMLVLAIVIALMGIGNTLALSIHERTRELGVLRAIGQTQRQVRSMIRGESVIISLLGTSLGVGLGVLLGWAFVRSAATAGIGTFSATPGQLAIVVVVGALAGVLAARRPARRASRLEILDAIATD